MSVLENLLVAQHNELMVASGYSLFGLLNFKTYRDKEQLAIDKAKYWFTRDKMDKIIKVHDYLDSLPEIGKVLSFGSILRVAEDLNNKELQSLEIAVLYSKIPNSIKNEIITPRQKVKECNLTFLGEPPPIETKLKAFNEMIAIHQSDMIQIKDLLQ